MTLDTTDAHWYFKEMIRRWEELEKAYCDDVNGTTALSGLDCAEQLEELLEKLEQEKKA